MRHAALLCAALVLAAACAAAPAAAGPRPGKLLWSHTFNAAQDWCAPTDTALGPDGSLYVAGFAGPVGGATCDFVLAKYSPSGARKWVRTWDGPSHSFDQAVAVAVSPAGLVVLTGLTTGNLTSYDMATVAWNFSGHRLWTKIVAGPGLSLDEGTDVVATAAGAVYVAGGVGGNGTGLDFTVIKYAKNGRQLWRRAIDGSAHDRDCANALALDAAGNVYAAGVMYITGNGQDLAVAKYTPSGHRAWLRTWNGPYSLHEWAQDVAVGHNAVTAVGAGDGAGFRQKAVYASYSLSGHVKFAGMMGADDITSSWLDAVAVDRTGHIVAGGWEDFGSGGGADMLVMRMNPDGSLVWGVPIGGWEGDNDQIVDVAVTGDGTIYACGSIATETNGTDVVVMRLDSQATCAWWGQYEKAGDDDASALAVSASGVYVAGETGSPAAVFKYKL